jgi:S-methyl-5-thioribose-1-phosphate isomerase
MKYQGKNYTALWREGDRIQFIDQRRLPFSFEVYTARTVDDIAFAIKDMIVRGAPAIGAAAAYGMAINSHDPKRAAQLLETTRPTAHDLFYAVRYMAHALHKGEDPFIAADQYVEELLRRCRKIGEHGAQLVSDGTRILTHCNAGALATVDYGTALAVLREAHSQEKKMYVYADETRPRLQGLLTAWELFHEGIPFALIADNAAGYYMQNGDIDFVIVGADRIAKNGDVANKIGTYEKAVLAHHNDIPFYVAAPENTFDLTLLNGTQIVIEERFGYELKEVHGARIMPDWVPVKNPAFDVTPHQLISGYITENGIRKTWL